MLYRLLLLALSWLVIWLICSLGNEMESFWNPSLDRQSATWLVWPRMYLNLKWYGNVLIKILCSLGVAWFWLFESITSRGFWSVSSINSFPYRKWWNFSITYATANGSSSITTYPFCVSVNALLAKYTGFSFWRRHAPKPLQLALVCSIVGLIGL